MENKNNRACAFNECLAYHVGTKIYIISLEKIPGTDYQIKSEVKIERG